MTLAIISTDQFMRKNSENLPRFQIIEAVHFLKISKTYDIGIMILGCSALTLKYISIIVAMVVKKKTRRSKPTGFRGVNSTLDMNH